MPTVLITGSNRGVGLGLAQAYAGDGWSVIATCRNPGRAADLAAVRGDIAVHPLDVTAADQIAGLAADLKGVPIDLLINNAGVYGSGAESLGRLDPGAWAETFRTNSIAPVMVTTALLDNLNRGQGRTVVGITSRMGSIGEGMSGHYAYRSSKAALNAAFVTLGNDLRRHNICVVVMHPGWVRTSMGGSGAPMSPSDSAATLKRVIGGLTIADTGRFLNCDGREIPW